MTFQADSGGFGLAGRVALITGGAGGFGTALARRFAESGAVVALSDLRADAAEEVAASLAAKGSTARAFPGDVSSPHDCNHIVSETLKAFGRIDILINNAGVMGRLAPLQDVTDADWDRVMNIDLKSVFLMSRAVIPNMRDRRSGSIVNVSSIAGKEGTPNLIPYSVAKAGIIGFTKALGKEVAADGIRVNCVAPGAIDTALLDQLTPESTAIMLSKVPMGRFGTTDEVAAVIHFLASDASTFITAQCLDASGGRATY